MKEGCLFLFLLFSTPLLAQQLVKDTLAYKKHTAINITGIPIVNYSSSYGTIIGVNSMAFFDVSKKDTISPASLVGLGGGYSENRSWFVADFTQLYLKEDKWRVSAGVGVANINFQYFEPLNDVDDGEFIDYNSASTFALIKVLRQIVPNFYGGAAFKFQHSKTVFEVNNDSVVIDDANGMGITGLYDTRDNIYYPGKGWKASLSFLGNTKWLGSDQGFNSIRAYANYYRRINEKSILASRASIFTSLGDVPFTAQRTVGGKDIRGYTDGRYRGDQVYCLQSEYRWTFYKRWGVVGFFGVALTENPSSNALPAGGIGIRFKAIRSRNINIGVDGALGNGDAGIYFRIGEAF